MSFPKEFLFAASTAAYQIEGAWNEDGKGENIWDRLSHTRPDLIKNHDNGDVACDSYHRYKEDVHLLKEIGFDVYRFSISWARILPNGEITKINQAGVDYYHSLIDELLKNGIQPMVTVYHWDLPQRLQDMGGWLNPLIVDYVEDYADFVFKLYGDKVKWWITINEPKQVIQGYQRTTYAPCLDLDSPADYIVAHNILRAHGRVYRLYDSKYRATQNGKISITIVSRYYKSKTESREDREAANRAYTFLTGMLAHPIYSKEGDYPKLLRETVDANSKREGRRRSRLPTFTPEEKESIKGSYDYFALNYYTSHLCSVASPNPSPNLNASYTFMKDLNVQLEVDPQWPSSKATWLKVTPWGISDLLRHLKETYGNLPIFITENGYCSDDKLEDKERVRYYQDHLSEILNAMNNYGCNVIGYTAWSLLDNFEWMDGYDNCFGLIHVDFKDKNRKRTLKKSAGFFKEFLQTRVLLRVTEQI